MPGRHRQSVPPRVVPKRLIAAGASGVVTVLALAPLAHADSPTGDVTTSAAPSSDTPTSAAAPSVAPSSDAPSSDTPSTPTSASATPSSDAPSTEAPSSSEVPTSPAPSAPSSTTTAPVKQRAVQATPSYGSTKIAVAAQLDQSDYYPSGTTSAGSVITVHETGPNAPASDFTCTTTATAGQTASYCGGVNNPFGDYTVKPGDIATVTQTHSPAGTVADPAPQSVPLCTTPDTPGSPQFPITTAGCKSNTLTFTATGLPPVVTDASQPLTVKQNQPVTISPDSQINRQGAPATSVDVDQPAHGKVTVNQAAAPFAVTNTPVTRPFTLTYTPAAGYAGPDSYRYRVTTANGTSAYVTVSLRVVGAAPTAVDDKDTTTQGDAVRIAALDNDTTNGGGAVRLSAVADPKHGTARISGSKIIYTPKDSFSGTEKFSYTITSYSGTDTASITVKVKADSTDTGNDGAGTDSGNVTKSETSTADTGTPSATLLEFGGALLVAGAGATIVGRRRRRESV